ncbi:hypothetical protein O181_080299 [Austropuccinia psidii MF-1]|uniref:Uncharacterized protein n=1 Tax=Austropuccinia psidii MF-1 TaxID=1389203 RepID=A0A9Q3FK49_9BASI|nr:hypothetical protein [Austropuccinia psidii MF-1]
MEKSDYPANEGWQWREDIQAWADCHHVLSPMGFKRQEHNPPNPPPQDSPVPCMPLQQTPQQPTPGLSGTQWSEDLFRKPSQHDEPPIPGLSQPSEPHGDTLTREPEPEVAPMQSIEEPLGKYFFYCFPVPNFHSTLLWPSPAHPSTPALVIIINDMPIGSPPHVPPPSTPTLEIPPISPGTQPPPPLIPTMRLARNLLTYNQPESFLKPLSTNPSTKSCWSISDCST